MTEDVFSLREVVALEWLIGMMGKRQVKVGAAFIEHWQSLRWRPSSRMVLVVPLQPLIWQTFVNEKKKKEKKKRVETSPQNSKYDAIPYAEFEMCKPAQFHSWLVPDLVPVFRSWPARFGQNLINHVRKHGQSICRSCAFSILISRTGPCATIGWASSIMWVDRRTIMT